MHHRVFLRRFLLLVLLSVPSLALGASPIQERADRFLKLANAGYQALFHVKRVAAETKQASIMNSFEFKLSGQKITANQIDDKLEKSTDLNERKAVWEASKESGPALKPNLVRLRDLRNGVAKEVKYPDYFSLQVASYGMTTNEMLKML